MKLYANNKCLDLSFPQIMGILNFTPDSFSDSGQFFSLDKALFQVEKMLKEGATIIDIGGESTRPMAEEVSEAEELQRVIPLVEAVQKRFDCWISVDTSKAIVMQEAAKVGMDLINDIRALREPGALEIAGQLNLPTCIMHMQGQPRTMQTNPHYDDVVQDVYQFLTDRTQACLAAYPVLAGLSRKSMIGAVLDKPVTERVVGSVAGALIAAQNGATILRVHDVAATADALKVWQATKEA